MTMNMVPRWLQYLYKGYKGRQNMVKTLHRMYSARYEDYYMIRNIII